VQLANQAPRPASWVREGQHLPFRAWPRKYHLKCRRGCHAGIRPNSTAMHTSQSRHFATPDPTVPCHPLQPSVATGGECRHLGASVLGHVQGDAVHFTLSHRNQPYNSPVQTSRPSLVDVHSSTLISAEPPVAPAPRHGPILVPPLFASRPRPPCSPCGRPLSRIRPPRAVLRLPRRPASLQADGGGSVEGFAELSPAELGRILEVNEGRKVGLKVYNAKSQRIRGGFEYELRIRVSDSTLACSEV
jgi:hypothetical protein